MFKNKYAGKLSNSEVPYKQSEPCKPHEQQGACETPLHIK